MSNLRQSGLAAFLVLLMALAPASAFVSSWVGPSALSGSGTVVADGFQVPGNSTILDAWLEVGEDGMTHDGVGIGWHSDNSPGNFSSGVSSMTSSMRFDGALSLEPDSTFSNRQGFTSASLQFANGWSGSTEWTPIDPTSLGGTVNGATRTLSHGDVPAQAFDGTLVAGTSPGSPLAQGSNLSLVSPSIVLPSPINNMSLDFDHWYHIDDDSGNGGDGVWVEYKLDNGTWTYVIPVGGYNSNIDVNASVPNGANGSGFPVWASSNASGWVNANFSLDNISGISNATQIEFRFRVWTDSGSIGRPGWFLDSFDISNQGGGDAAWEWGCKVAFGTCSYPNNADEVLEFPMIDLSNATNNTKVRFYADWDIEGSSYDNWWLEASLDNNSWTDVLTPSLTYTNPSTWYTDKGVPSGGITINNNQHTDDSGGFELFEVPLPANYPGDPSIWIRFRVETDGSVGYGSSTDEREGFTIDDVSIVSNNGTHFMDDFRNSTTVFPSGNASTHQWNWDVVYQGMMSFNYSFEDSPSLPPGGWIINNSATPGWEFGPLGGSTPSAFPSPTLGFGTNLNGDYVSNSWNHLISPLYTIPQGASSNFAWSHWMCAEDTWDGGALYMSVNNGSWQYVNANLSNGSSWYDGLLSSNSNSVLSNMMVWDGRQYQSFSCSGAAVPWRNLSLDLAAYAGNSLRFRFSFVSDSSATEEGWYIDDVGVDVDLFEESGTWVSPLIPVNELGLGMIDVDATLPFGTGLRASLLDNTGQVIPGFSNMSLPASLSALDTSSQFNVKLRLELSTNDTYVTPVIHEVFIGAKRYLNSESTIWQIPSGVSVNSTGSLVNNGGLTQTLSTGYIASSRPIGEVELDGVFNGVTLTILDDSGAQIGHQLTTSGAITTFNSPQPGYALQVSLAPGGSIDNIETIGGFLQPALDASIDLIDDGVTDWEFDSSNGQGAMGWQLTSSVQNLTVGTQSSIDVKVPTDAMVTGVYVSSASDDSASMNLSSNSQTLLNQLSTNSALLECSLCASYLNMEPSTYQDGFGRNWSVLTIDIEPLAAATEVSISIIARYTLLENVTGLGDVVRTYHEANSNNGLEKFVDIPLSFDSLAGGVSISGGIFHELLITNEPFTVPRTWYPTGIPQGFSTGHHHLNDNDLITDIVLTGESSDGTQIQVEVTDLLAGGVFTQTSGSGLLLLDLGNCSATIIGGSWIIDWSFIVDWDWDDESSVEWQSQAYDVEGEGLSPASATSGGPGSQASENDLEIEWWKVEDENGNDISNQFDSKYPFYGREGAVLNVSGAVRFQNSADTRPLADDYLVSIDVSGTPFNMVSDVDGLWSGNVILPQGVVLANLTPAIIRIGPITGANGADDVSSASEVTVQIDSNNPMFNSIMIDTGQGLAIADGYTWNPDSDLVLQVEIEEPESMGSELNLFYWREGVDDSNGDGFAQEEEYQSLSKPLNEGTSGTATVSFQAIDVSGNSFNQLVSVYLQSTDFSGLELVNGGSFGLDNDVATIQTATNEPTIIDANSVELDVVNELLLPGLVHSFSFEVEDENGVDSLNLVELRLAGKSEELLAVIEWEPRNGEFRTSNESHIELYGVLVEEVDEVTSKVTIEFILDWDFPQFSSGVWAIPALTVWDDDPLNPVFPLSQIGNTRWRVADSLEIDLQEIIDNTPTISESGEESIIISIGDDVTFNGVVKYSGTDVIFANDGLLQVIIQGQYGNDLLLDEVDVNPDGSWSAGIVFPNRLALEPDINLSLTLENLPGTMVDSTTDVAIVTVDGVAPKVTISEMPLEVSDQELSSLTFGFSIEEAGGLGFEELTIHWRFSRAGIGIPGGSSSAVLSMTDSGADKFTFAGNVDFSSGITAELEPGDSLAWWLDFSDAAGNVPTGSGTNPDDSMLVIFNVHTFDVAISDVEILLENGKESPEIVEGTKLFIRVKVRNLGTLGGDLEFQLVEDARLEGRWYEHGAVQVKNLPGREQVWSDAFEYETHGGGSQHLILNISGDFSSFVSNPAFAGCILVNETLISCELDNERDMPDVLAKEDVKSEDSWTIVIILIGVVLIIIGLAIVVILNRDDSESMMYDEWEDETEFVEEEMKSTPEIPPTTTIDEPEIVVEETAVSEEE